MRPTLATHNLGLVVAYKAFMECYNAFLMAQAMANWFYIPRVRHCRRGGLVAAAYTASARVHIRSGQHV